VGPLRATPLGYQQVTSLTTAIGLTMPLGAQQASGTACSLASKLLTVGGTVTGTFAIGQTVTGTGIPANTTIVQAGSAPSTWVLSSACTTEASETVTAYDTPRVDFAIIRVTAANVYWRDDGTAPTATVGMPLLSTDTVPFEYYGDPLAIQFIAVSGSPVLDVSYYRLAG
jgi:hypothetical protein